MISVNNSDVSLYDRYYSKVRSYIFGKVGDINIAEDLASDVFLKVYEKSASYDNSKASASTWIYTITRNTVIDYFRTHKIFTELTETAEDSFNVEEQVLNNETLELLADALEKLEERERDVVIFHYYSGLTLKVIADKMNISYSYVKLIHSKSLEKLRNFLEK